MIKEIKIPILPLKTTFFGEKQTLDLKAICIFSALGFFLDQDSYFLEQKALQPASSSIIDENNVCSISYFKWHYSPVERPLEQIVQEFAVLFETIIKDQVGNQTVILPLSGGLDSRTQAAALHHLGNKVNAYSYEFTDGHNETLYSEKIAKVCGFSFEKWQIGEGYLWNKIEQLANINGCYSEFTHPRQMAFIEKYAAMGDVFSLGHWGDVLFDAMGVPDDLTNEEQVEVLLKKVIKKGGLELANALWSSWDLEGDFETYLKNRITSLLTALNIPNSANAQIRAFKSLYWAPRWTSTNLSVFESVKPISLPYYDNRMCAFICTVPEKYLAGRQIQIAYLKMRMPALAKITWQDHRPFNLYNYGMNRVPYNLPYRILQKLKRTLSSEKLIQRNWELQFVGTENERHLRRYLFQNEKMNAIIPQSISSDFYQKFHTENGIYYSHSISMLLALSLFFSREK
jgi:hypothetical protein